MTNHRMGENVVNNTNQKIQILRVQNIHKTLILNEKNDSLIFKVRIFKNASSKKIYTHGQ